VSRSAADQVAFGWGPHACVGQHLAKLEMAAIFRALATKVERLHIEEEVRNVHNVLRGFSGLIISVE
jgi:cytochrome P450